MPKHTKPLLTESMSLAAAARRVGVSKPVITAAVQSGKLKTIEDAGGDRRVVIDDLKRWRAGVSRG